MEKENKDIHCYKTYTVPNVIVHEVENTISLLAGSDPEDFEDGGDL